MILCLIAHKKIDVSAAKNIEGSQQLEPRSESNYLVNTHPSNWGNDDQDQAEHPPASRPQHQDEDDVIIVVAVDGTLAGLDRTSGEILWKQSGSKSRTSTNISGGLLSTKSTNMQSSGTSTGYSSTIEDDSSAPSADNSGWKPLLSTSTTTQSQRKYQWKTTAVPSIDGRVFLGPPGEETETLSVEDIVNRSPFLDLKGRFHVGSTVRSATAIDGTTGEILRVVGDPNEQTTTASVRETFEGRTNVVWLGRVDHSVTIHDARTGTTDVEFAVSNLMTMNDMAKLSAESDSGENDKSSQQHHLYLPNAFEASFEEPSPLIATPGGNIAFRNLSTGSVDWVAPESFDTPIVFAMDSRTGQSLGVDMVPDAPMPDSSAEVIARSLERQLSRLELDHESSVETDPTIVGAMSNGQLFAMPLGKRKSYQPSLPSTPTHPAIASASAANSNRAQYHARVPQLGGSHRQKISSGRSSQESGSGVQLQAHNLPYMTSKPCNPSSPYYPGCLVGQRYQQYQSYARKGDEVVSESGPEIQDDRGGTTDERQANHAVEMNGYHYHPELGYSEEYIRQYHQQQQKRTYNQALRIMGSWIAPTVALIFVVSFELGRRKRQKDEAELEASRAHAKLDETLKQSGQFVPIPEHKKEPSQQHVIQVSEKVLGYGGHGTVVYKGMLDGRSVAVKRMLQVYHASADREISLLIESDGHPNVVRYFLKEVRGDFVYLALELCDLSLHDLIGSLRSHDEFLSDQVRDATKRVLLQIASGVKHLHSLRIVHRDLKPANILLGSVNKRKSSREKSETEDTYQAFLKGKYVAKISDMGLGKQLVGQSSFGMSTLGTSTLQGQSQTNGESIMGVGPGSVGWQAPEVMSYRLSSESSVRSSEGNSASLAEASPLDTSPNTRTSRSVDVFSLGCIFYSALVPGAHPFGEWFEREANIMHNRPNLEELKKVSPDAHNLVASMISRNPKMRPTAKQICDHPFFWTPHQRLSFLCDFSDRLESDASDNTKISRDASKVLMTNPLAIERNAFQIVGTAWDKCLDPVLIDNVQRFRSYDTTSVRDLLRLIRNKYHHFDELPATFRESIGSTQAGLLEYFESRFPLLMVHCFSLCRQMLASDDPLAAKYSIPSSALVCAKRVEKPLAPSETRSSNSSTNNDLDAPSDIILEPSAGDAEENERLTFESSSEHEKRSSPAGDSPDDLSAISDHRATLERKTVEDGKESDFVFVYEVPVDAGPSEANINDALGGQEKDPNSESNESSPNPTELVLTSNDNIIIWEQSTAAKSLNCRGWIRSDDEWTRRAPAKKKMPTELQRCVDDPKFRTRLCNHWDVSLGCHCPMRRKNKCVFAHGPVELRVKEAKKGRWGRLVDKHGNNSNPRHSGGEDTYGAARSIESVRKEEGKWNTSAKGAGSASKTGGKGIGGGAKGKKPSGGGAAGRKKTQTSLAASSS